MQANQDSNLFVKEFSKFPGEGLFNGTDPDEAPNPHNGQRKSSG